MLRCCMHVLRICPPPYQSSIHSSLAITHSHLMMLYAVRSYSLSLWSGPCIMSPHSIIHASSSNHAFEFKSNFYWSGLSHACYCAVSQFQFLPFLFLQLVHTRRCICLSLLSFHSTVLFCLLPPFLVSTLPSHQYELLYTNQLSNRCRYRLFSTARLIFAGSLLYSQLVCI